MFGGVLLDLFVTVCHLETSTMRWSRANLGCCATKKNDNSVFTVIHTCVIYFQPMWVTCFSNIFSSSDPDLSSQPCITEAYLCTYNHITYYGMGPSKYAGTTRESLFCLE
jgi:hypothetical protein